ncbi:MAG: hypothetical protein HYZ28_00590 [Myxococcales bacterium]|nr:hypothetical protein [Myxococcales bacterium]
MPARLRHDSAVDAYSREVFRKAERLAKDPRLSVSERQRRLEAFAAEREVALAKDFRSGRISRDQFDGGTTALDGPGGELGEIRQAARLAKELLGGSNAAKKLGQNPLTFTSDLFHNLTLTGTSDSGRPVHLRFGTHGGLETRAQNPQGDGFPFPGSKWVEGDVVVGDRVYSFVDTYTDNFKVDLGPDGKPAAIRFRGEVEVKRLSADVLTPSADKWTARKSPTQPEGRATVEFHIPLTSPGGETARFGLPGLGYEDTNHALAAKGGTITIRPAGNGPAEVLKLGEAAGQLEAGVYRNVPRQVQAAYKFAQGQQLDTSKVFERALSAEPREVLRLLEPGSALAKEVEEVVAGQPPTADLARRVDAKVCERSKSSPHLRRLAAPLLVRHLGGMALPRLEERKTSTQFEARLLSEDFASRLISRLAGRLLDAAGALGPDGKYHSYEGNALLELLERNPDLVDPVAVLNVNHVPLFRDGAKHPALLERRTDLLFDVRAGKFALGFQEVFHDR